MRKLLYIERLVIAVLLLLLLALAPAKAQNVAYTGQTTPLEVMQIDGEVYTWELFNDLTVNFTNATGVTDTAPYAEFVGSSIGAAVKVLWKQPGTYIFRVNAVDASGCARNLKLGIIEVKASAKAVITPPTVAACAGVPISLVLTLTGTAPWNFTYTAKDSGGVITTDSRTDVMDNPYTLVIDPGPATTTEYTITKISDINGENTEPSNTVTQIVHPLPAPTTIYHR